MWVKICGVTCVEDALEAAQAGADAIGLNFCADSPRYLEVAQARVICDALEERFPKVERVGVFVDQYGAALGVKHALVNAHLHTAQLHGDEPPAVAQVLSRWGVPVIKALRLAPEDDLEAISGTVDAFLGACEGRGRVLVDARVPGAHGGTGKRLDLDFVRALVARRPVLVAGGLTPENVAQVTALGEGVLGVDVASGVERPGGRKDTARVASFILAARQRG